MSRVAFAAAGLGALALAAGPGPLLLGGAALCLAGLLFAAWHERAWSIGLSWIGAAAAFAGAVTPRDATLPDVALACVSVAAVSVGVFLPILPSGQVRWRQAASWTLVPAAAAAIAWGPALAVKGDRVALLEPLTAAGAALRLLGAVALLALFTLALVALRREDAPVAGPAGRGAGNSPQRR